MPNTPHLIRQWLETDAAFGVTEVPLSTATPPPNPNLNLNPSPAPPLARPRPVATPTPSLSAPPPPAPSLSEGDPLAKRKPAPSLPPTPEGNIADLPPLTRKQKETALAVLQKQIEHESKPYLSDVASRVVFGEGDADADLLFVGEGPGIEEDKTGRPFVGRSGQLLDKMIAAINMKREPGGGVYIANVVKLRAADWDESHTRLTDRPPSPEEVARGIPYLHQQIEIIRPKVIVTLGAPALKYLTGKEGIMKIRGTWLAYRGIPLMPTYHPAFVLRAYTEENRRKVWSDLKNAAAKIQNP